MIPPRVRILMGVQLCRYYLASLLRDLLLSLVHVLIALLYLFSARLVALISGLFVNLEGPA